MNKKTIKEKMLTIIREDLEENFFDWKEYLIETEMARLEEEELPIITNYLTPDTEKLAELIGVSEKELEKILEG